MIAPSEYGHHQGSSGSSVRFPNPANLESSAPASSQSSSSYNAFAGNNAPYPRCNTNALRRSRHFVPNECKDEYYWHKRLKNNEAARKSRQKRRNIDSVLEEKVLVLSHENDMLRNELYNLKVKYGEIPPPDPTKYSTAQPLEPSPSDSKGLSSVSTSNRSITATPDGIQKQDGSQQVFNRSLSQDPKLQIQDPASAAAALHKAMAAKNAAAAVLPNVMTNKAGSSSAAASVHIAAAQSGMQFPTNLLLSHLASGTYVLSPVSPNAPQNLMAGSPLLAPVSQQTIVTVQQNPITSGQQRDGAQLVGFPGGPSHQVPHLPVQTAASLNTLKMQQHLSPRDTPPPPSKDSDTASISSAPSPRASIFSFEQVAHEQQQRNNRKGIEQQYNRHRKNSRQQQQISNEPMNLEFKGGEGGRSSATLATQTSPVSYYQAQTPPAAAIITKSRTSDESTRSSPSPAAARSLITGFMPIQAEASSSSSRKQGKQYHDKAHKDTKSSDSSAEGHEQRSRGRTARTQSEDSYEGEMDETSSKRGASPSPTRHHEESYQVYRKAFHKMQDEQDFEAAATLATLSKRSKLHHLEPSSYSLDPVSSSLQPAGGDEDGRKHRLPHKMRFKNMGDGPQEGEQQQQQQQPS